MHHIPLAWKDFFDGLLRVLIDFSYGSSAYGVSRELMMQRAELEQIFLSMLIGEQLGLPVYSSYYARRLFPYLLPRLAGWKRSLVRPRGVGGW